MVQKNGRHAEKETPRTLVLARASKTIEIYVWLGAALGFGCGAVGVAKVDLDTK